MKAIRWFLAFTALLGLTAWRSAEGGVPQKALKVLDYVRAHEGRAPEGYEGGREFKNFEAKLPRVDARGRRLRYREYDVNPHRAHVGRGVERLVVGSDGKAYYTRDHYRSFIPVP